jgi:hypothetical protein
MYQYYLCQCTSNTCANVPLTTCANVTVILVSLYLCEWMVLHITSGTFITLLTSNA